MDPRAILDQVPTVRATEKQIISLHHALRLLHIQRGRIRAALSTPTNHLHVLHLIRTRPGRTKVRQISRSQWKQGDMYIIFISKLSQNMLTLTGSCGMILYLLSSRACLYNHRFDIAHELTFGRRSRTHKLHSFHLIAWIRGIS